MTLRIVALDPGGTTGWATFTAEQRYDPEERWVYYKPKFTCGMLEGQMHHKQLSDMLGLFQTDSYTVVSESFEYRNRARAGLELISCEYIGVTKLFCQERNTRLVMQTASMGKITKNSFVKKHNLEKLGLWSPGMVHAMDAYGHLLYYMINNAGIMKHELLAKGWRG